MENQNAKSNVINKRNYEIDFWKFVFCIFVMLTHSKYISEVFPKGLMFAKAGHIAVFFYFTVSGFLMINSFEKREKNIGDPVFESINFEKNKIRFIGKDYFFATLISFFTYLYIIDKTSGLTVSMVKMLSFKGISEFLGIYATGLFEVISNESTWYISAMLIVILPLYYFMCKNKKFFIYIFCPLIFIFLLGWRYASLDLYNDFWMGFNGITTIAIIKAVIGICGGGISYILCKKIKEYEWTKLGKTILTIVEVVGWYSIIEYSLFAKGDDLASFSVQIVFVLVIGIVFSNQSYVSLLFRCSWIKYLGIASLPLYLNHWTIRRVLEEFYAENNYFDNLIIFFIGSIILAAVEYFGIRFIIKIFERSKIRLVKANKQV